MVAYHVTLSCYHEPTGQPDYHRYGPLHAGVVSLSICRQFPYLIDGSTWTTKEFDPESCSSHNLAPTHGVQFADGYSVLSRNITENTAVQYVACSCCEVTDAQVYGQQALD